MIAERKRGMTRLFKRSRTAIVWGHFSMASSSFKGSFVPLGRHAYIRRSTSTASASSTAPTYALSQPKQVILLFGWMSAKLAHLHKYTEMYREIYPHATLVLVRSHISFLYMSTSAVASIFILPATVPYLPQGTRFAPVIEALEALGCLNNCQRILTHTFSNGGTIHLVAFARMLSSKTIDSQNPRSPSALIVDSSPGGDSLEKSVLALTSPVRNPLLKLLASFCVVILRRPSPVQTIMATLRNPRILPWIDERSPRMYIYSKTDEMVPWADIEGHAVHAASEGLDVRRLCFDKSPHVAHARVYPQEYWTAVAKRRVESTRSVDGRIFVPVPDLNDELKVTRDWYSQDDYTLITEFVQQVNEFTVGHAAIVIKTPYASELLLDLARVFPMFKGVTWRGVQTI
ncbi:hypothetical protein C8R44DRAFT_854944 [Mycena epipterygia]|nr:hypothetical protein C8R44DRAFT_854944 [Mycena epipterygia]